METRNNNSYIFSVVTMLLVFVFLPQKALCQGNVLEPEKPSKYVENVVESPKLNLFQGFTLAADLFGPAQYLLSDYGNVEACLRLNLKNTYFPVAEVGYAECNTTDENTDIKYKTNAPYLRIGFDVNMLKNKFQDNRLYLGARYGFSSYQFDISGPAIVDPIFGGAVSFDYRGIATTSHWAEIVAGVQVKIWHSFHMAWSIRYKQELSSSKNNYAKPYYIPGYGTTTNSSVWGATYSLVFDLNWGKKHNNIPQ